MLKSILYNDSCKKQFRGGVTLFLKKLSVNKLISIDYYSNGSLKTIKGRVYKLDPIKQSLLLKDETHKPFTIQLSGIRQIY